MQGWPRPKGCINIKKGQEVIVSTEEGMAHDNVLPIEFSGFDKMCAEGDTLFVGRYLTNGADVSSVYMDVSTSSKKGFHDTCCIKSEFCPLQQLQIYCRFCVTSLLKLITAGDKGGGRKSLLPRSK